MKYKVKYYDVWYDEVSTYECKADNEIACLDTDTDYIKVEYIETLSYNAKEAKEDAYSYINRFPNVSHPTLMEVYRA